MSKVIVTNTKPSPVFVAGKMLGVDMSMEVELHQVPECLQPVASVAAAGAPHESPDATHETKTAPTDEELLVAAAKAKGK